MPRKVSGNGGTGVALSTSAISRALAAEGLTDAQARAAIGSAASLSEGLIAAGLIKRAPATASGLTKLGQIGFNVEPDYGQGDSTFLFLDRMKSSGLNGLWKQNGPTYDDAPISAYGYPTGTGGANSVITFVGLHVPETGQPAIRHVLRHNGTGLSWTWFGTNIISNIDASNPNRVEFDVNSRLPGDDGVPQLQINSATTWPNYKPGNPQATRDGIAVYELVQEALYLAGELFHPAAIEDYSKHHSLRFMDAFRTNAVVAIAPADRTLVGCCSYGPDTAWGMPLEVAVALCNKAKAHFWYNMPHAANDAYQAAAFAYIRDNLDPDLYVELEYSNEVWNGDFGNQNNFAKQQGQALQADWNEHHGYGYLAAKMVKKAREVFGPNQSHRILAQFARQGTVLHSYTQAALGAEAFEGKKTRDYFAAVSVGFYLDGGAQVLVFDSSSPAQKQLAFSEADYFEANGTNRQALVDQMRTGTAIPGWPATSALVQLDAQIQQAADFARAEGIPHLTGYEGQNFHVNALALGQPGLRITSAFKGLANDVRISGTQAGSLMRDQYAMMRGKGMTGFHMFLDYGPVNIYGLWGTKLNVFAPDNRIWDFYEWYQANHPDDVLFEINVTGGGNILALNEASERTITTFGGLMPATAVSLQSGTLPAGMTFVNGKLAGTPTVAGSYPVVFAATDGGGRTITAARTFTVAVATNYRYFRITPKANRNGGVAGETFARFGSAEIALKDGATTIAPTGWTATAPGSNFGGNVPDRVCDGAVVGSFITEQGQGPGQVIIDTKPGEGFKPTSLLIYDCNEAVEFSFNGVIVEVSRNGTAWVTVADVAVGAMTYTGRFCNLPLTYPA